MIKPAINILSHRTLHSTRIHLLHRLRLQNALVSRTSAPMEHTAIVHGALQTVALPTKHIVRVCPIALAIGVAPHKWLRTIGGPHVIKDSGVPHRFVCELGHLDGVGGWARTGWAEAAFCGGEHVGLVVR